MGKIRVVLDNNVLVSAIGWEGLPGKIFESCVKGDLALILSINLLDELKNVIYRGKLAFIPDDKKEMFLSLLTEISEITMPRAKLNVILDDASDNRILECAVAGKAGYIISGDKHLLSLKTFSGIKIVTPANFLSGAGDY
jgi:putative PIN family toxin of toxin-antitoxin system